MTANTPASFWLRTAAVGDCLEWQGGRLPRGYGQLSWQGKQMGAHRVAWMLANNAQIPEGMTVDHLCFNPPCVKPDHLRLLSWSDNSARQKRALARFCKRGHEFTPENTRMKSCGGGRWFTRACRACDQMHNEARNARRRAARATA